MDTYRSEIEAQAAELDRVIQSMNAMSRDPLQMRQMKSTYDGVIQLNLRSYDSEFGGFGSIPKFPPYNQLRLMMDAGHYDCVHYTLTKMALSGLYDQVEGGFHRYSTDDQWRLPHFEKMLTDNAQMIELYSLAYAHQPNDLYRRVVEQTIAHLQSVWQHDNGLFCHSMDADSDGEEGLYYTLTSTEFESMFSDFDDITLLMDHFQITKTGNFEDEATGELTGQNILHPISDQFPMDIVNFRERLLAFRAENRDRPVIDSYTYISANALLLKGLFIAANVFLDRIG